MVCIYFIFSGVSWLICTESPKGDASESTSRLRGQSPVSSVFSEVHLLSKIRTKSGGVQSSLSTLLMEEPRCQNLLSSVTSGLRTSSRSLRLWDTCRSTWPWSKLAMTEMSIKSEPHHLSNNNISFIFCTTLFLTTCNCSLFRSIFQFVQK